MGKILSAGVAALVAVCGCAGAEPVRIESGLVEGVETDGVAAFKALPYAAPPVGDRRWRPPAPPVAWEGVRKASDFGPACPQKGAYPEVAPPAQMSEDCLTLNVWTPVDRGAAALPVMVWIHGGGLVNGSASTPVYDGAALARRGVVLVTVNYRLGALGFLAHPDLDRETPAGVSGNYGLMDQIAALSWVRRNISAFGGDPGAVTIFGQSSGAMSVSMLIASPAARGLFRRAIGESGGVFEPVEFDPAFSPAGASEAGRRFASRVGARSVAELRRVGAQTLVETPFHPQFVIDGRLLPLAPHDAYASGRRNAVDLLVGSNAKEGAYFVQGTKIDAANLHETLERGFPGWLVALVGVGRPKTDAEALEAAIAFNGDMRFGWDMWAWARYAAKTRDARTYSYEFDAAAPFPQGHPYSGLGATHGMEMPYVFGTWESWGAVPTQGDVAVSETVQTYWTNFARTGDPNGAGLVAWPTFGPSDRTNMHLGPTPAPGPIARLDKLHRIDAVYATARFIARHPLIAAGGALLLGLSLIFVLMTSLFRLVTRRA